MAKQTDRGLENREIILGVLTEVLEKGSFVHLVLNQALININIWLRQTEPLSPVSQKGHWSICFSWTG